MMINKQHSVVSLPLIKSFSTILDLFRKDIELKFSLGFLCCDLDELIDIRNDFLSREEQEYFSKLSSIARQRDYLQGRILAKQAISELVNGIKLSDINIKRGIFTQPIISHKLIDNLQVSISHSKANSVAIAFPEQHPMGIDIEICAADKVKAIKNHVSSIEISCLDECPFDLTEKYTLIWSVKEALSKLLKTGLMADFLVYQIELSNIKGEIVTSYFKHFHQYKAISVMLNNQVVLSIVLPRNTDVDISDTIRSIRDMLHNRDAKGVYR